MLNTPQELIDDIKAGKMVVLMDDEDRENEGDLVMAASHITADAINFMIRHARGLVCLTLTEERADQLGLGLMSDKNGAKFSTNFTVSIEAATGVTTGISAADRALTIQTAVAPYARPTDIVSPGHIFPIVAKQGGVLHRAGHTEAGCDLARLAGLESASVICEIIKDDGTMARRDDLEIFARTHGLKIGTIADLIEYRMAHEQTVSLIDKRLIDTAFGQFMLYRFIEYGAKDTHFALVKGNPKEGTTTVRVHTFDPLKDLFGVGATSWNLSTSLHTLGACERAVFVWIGEDGDNTDSLGLGQALDGLFADTATPAPKKSYSTIGVGSQILKQLGVKDMRLLSSQVKFNALSGFDLNVVEVLNCPHLP